MAEAFNHDEAEAGGCDNTSLSEGMAKQRMVKAAAAILNWLKTHFAKSEAQPLPS